MIGKEYEYRAMADCERELWWYRCLHELTLQKINKSVASPNVRILDAGCGTGGMLQYLIERGFTNVSGFDLSADAIHYARTNFQFDVSLLNILECDQKYDPQSFDIIITHDVLCLLKNGEDGLALKKLVSLLKPGGFVFSNFPAGGAFKGTHDVAVGINQRYSKERLREITNGIIKIKELVYWPFLLSPVIFAVRFLQRVKMLVTNSRDVLSDVKMPSPPLNKLFGNIISWENRSWASKPWGSSLFVVMQK